MGSGHVIAVFLHEMGSFLVGTRSHRASPCQSAASGFYCSVNRAVDENGRRHTWREPEELQSKACVCRKALDGRCQIHHSRPQRLEGSRVVQKLNEQHNGNQIPNFDLLIFCLFERHMFKRDLCGGQRSRWRDTDRQSCMTCFVPGHHTGTRLLSLWKSPQTKRSNLTARSGKDIFRSKRLFLVLFFLSFPTATSCVSL